MRQVSGGALEGENEGHFACRVEVSAPRFEKQSEGKAPRVLLHWDSRLFHLGPMNELHKTFEAVDGAIGWSP